MMKTKGPKIKELARALGTTARELLDRCRSAGLPVQNSVTRLNKNQTATVLGWYGHSMDDWADDEE